LIATSQIILRDTFPPEKIGSSSALFAVALTVGPALGPTLGGWLTDNFSWPWVFEINLVPGAIAAFIMLTMLRNPAEPKKLAFDWAGIGFLALGLGSLVFDRRTFFHSDVFRASVNANNPFWQHVAYGPAALATLARIAQQQATNAGFADAIWALVPLAFAAIVLALALRRLPRVAGPAPVPAPVLPKREAWVALRR
jgi:MFS family permease